MTINDLRLVASDGEAVPAGLAEVDARGVFDFLRTASAASASFHAVNHIDLVLQSEAIRSRWHGQASTSLVALQKAGLSWITDVWPEATVVPQAFVNVANRAAAFFPQIDSLLAGGNVAEGGRLLGVFGEEAAKQASEVAAYRAALEKVLGAAALPITALTTGSGSIATVIADDGAKIAELTRQIADVRNRMIERAKEIARQVELHKAKLEAFHIAFKYLRGWDGDKLLKEWGKSFITTIATGTAPGFQVEAFLRDIDEIMEKTAAIGELGRDVLALTNLGATLQSLREAQPLLDLRLIEAMLQTTRERAQETASAMRTKPSAETIAGARKTLAAEAERLRILGEHCQHFQEEAVEAQKPPTVVWLATPQP